MKGAYYNEFDPYAAQWLRNLIAAGHIAAGDVDERSIVDVRLDDLRSYAQCHFFAGIGVWSYALRLAGWPDDRPVWTGSCPCQPFSAAGKRKGVADERHLWPAWNHLIEVRRPPIVFGEQVASPDGLAWLDLVSSDMEGKDYAFAASDLCAAGVGAPHIRQRLYWVADADIEARGGRGIQRPGQGDGEGARPARERPAGLRADGRLADTDADGLGRPPVHLRERRQEPTLPDTGGAGDDRWSRATAGFWRDPDWLYCRDGKWRPVESGTFPLADGASARVGRLRAYGNAIVPQVAAAFIRAADSR